MYAVYYKKPHLTIYHDEDRSLGKSEWNGFVSGEAFRESAMACVGLIKEKQVRYWVADDRNMKAIRLKDQEWSNEVLMPALANSGLRKMALIVSRDRFNQLAVDSIIEKAGDSLTFEIKYFNEPKTAENWLGQFVQQDKNVIRPVSSTASFLRFGS
jgi:hypothetical protein